MEALGSPVGSEESMGIVEKSEGLVTGVSHFSENLEVVNLRNNLLAGERNRDPGSSKDRRRSSEESKDSCRDRDHSDRDGHWGG